MATRKKSKKELLRQRAEKLLSEKPHLASKLKDEDIKKLVHELQVYQVELEMQNEELRGAQAEIEESRTKYSDLYDFAPVGYFTFSQTGEIVEVNLTGASVLGVDRSLLLRRAFSAFVDPQFRSRFRDHRLNLLKRGAKERCELKLVRKDGEPFYASLESIVVPNGKNFRIRSVVSDITELKRAQQEAEAEHAFRMAIENSILSGIAAVDLEGRQSYVNLGFCRMVGRSQEELLGKKPPFAYWPPEESDRINKVFHTVRDDKAPREGNQLRLIRKNGECFDVLALSSPLKEHQGKIIGWVGTFGDITHLKQMENELKQLNTQLEERVRERTTELETTNEQLKQQIAKREQMEVWLTADLAALNRMHDLSGRLLGATGLQPLLQEVMDAAVVIVRAERGTLQLLEGDSLRIVAHHGHQQPFLDFFAAAENRASVCGEATRRGERVVIPDVEASSLFAGTPSLAVLRGAGVRAVQSTPMISRTGVLLGILTTQWGVPYSPDEHDLWRIDLLVRQAADLIEYARAEEELRKSRDELEIRVRERTADLAKANEELVAEIAERKQAEESLRKLTHDLNERVKQLNLLYSISYYVERQYTGLEEKLQNIASLISSGWQYPHIACARIVLEGNEYNSDNFKETAWKQTSDIVVNGETIGSIEVGYLEEKPTCDEGPFTREERGLINAIAIELGEMIGHMKSDKAIREQSKILEAFFTSTITPLVFLDRNFNFVIVNEAYANACQRDISEFPGRNHFEFYPHEENEAIFRQVVETKTPYQAFAKPFSFPDHPERGVTYWDWTLTPLLDDKREVELLVYSLEDVTEQKQAEDAFRKEYNFRKAIESSMVAGVAATDLSGALTYVNNAFCKMVGWSEDDLVGMYPPYVFWPPETAGVIKEFQHQLARKKSLEGFELRLRRRNEARFDTLVSISPLSDTKGETIGWVASFLDITDRKRTEDAIRLQADQLATMLATTPDGFWIFDTKGKLLDVNGAYCRMTGYSREELLRLSIPDIEAVETPEDTARRIRKVMDTGFHRFETRHRKKDGRILDVEISVSFWRATNRFVSFLRDVTERKRAEEALKAAHQYNRSLIEASVDPLVTINTEGKVTDVNSATEFATGVSREELIESDFSDYFTQPEKAREGYQRVFKEGLVRDYPLAIRHKSGMITHVLYNATVYRNEAGEIQGVFAAARDITKRKQAEEALRAAHQYTRGLIEASLDPLVTISPEGKIMDVNKETEFVTGVSREQLIGTDFSNYFTEPKKAQQGYEQVFRDESVRDYPLAIRHTSGKVTDVLYHATVFRNEAGEVQGVFAAARDVTELTEAHRRMEATNSLLNLFIRKSTRKEYLDSVIELIQPWSGCRCVGIRILNEKDYIPYESYVGFSEEFWGSENLVSVRYDQCACIRVVTGNPDAQDKPAMTPAGSFRCENMLAFFGSLSEVEKKRFRGICIKNGFQSVAIIPIRYREKIIGAIHIADECEGKVTLSRVQFIESMAPLIGEAVNRFSLEEELKDSEGRLRHLSSQLLNVQENERRRIAVELHDSIGQMLTAIKFKIEDTLQQKNLRKSLEAVIPLVRETIEETRRIQMDLRPSTLDDIGVLATLDWFCREYKKIYSHIRIEKEIGLRENDVSAPLKTVIYRMTQEALNNIAKHSQADLVLLTLQTIKGRVELIIKDNGTGFDLEEMFSAEKPKKGLGLTSMRERAELSGGSFIMESAPGAGTTIRASWPI